MYAIGRSRQRLAGVLNSAFAEGLLSEQTHVHAEGERLILGRDPTCDVVVTDPTVSRRHAQLTFRDGVWVLQDLASKNGTAVNGERVGRMVLHSGDVVALGAQPIHID